MFEIALIVWASVAMVSAAIFSWEEETLPMAVFIAISWPISLPTILVASCYYIVVNPHQVDFDESAPLPKARVVPRRTPL